MNQAKEEILSKKKMWTIAELACDIIALVIAVVCLILELASIATVPAFVLWIAWLFVIVGINCNKEVSYANGFLECLRKAEENK